DPTRVAAGIPDVGPRDVIDAWELIAYFKSQIRQVLAYLERKGLGNSPEGATWALNWIRNHPESEAFATSDLTKTYPKPRYDPAKIDDGLAWLARKNAIRRAPEPERPPGTPGKKPSARWEVHPDLRSALSDQSCRTHGERARREIPEIPDSPDAIGA